jgi:hypothetical protein
MVGLAALVLDRLDPLSRIEGVPRKSRRWAVIDEPAPYTAAAPAQNFSFAQRTKWRVRVLFMAICWEK